MDFFEKYYALSLRYLTRRPRSEKELQDYLKKKKASPEVSLKITQKLKEQRFLNDEEFTRWWVDQRLRFKPRSVFLIKRELLQKGVSKTIIESGIMNHESRTRQADRQGAVYVPKPKGQQIGRNDPCPCGSGKKYKVCGLRNSEEHQRLINGKQ